MSAIFIRHGLVPPVLILCTSFVLTRDNNWYAAVLLASCLSVIGRDRVLFAEAAGGDSIPSNPVLLRPTQVNRRVNNKTAIEVPLESEDLAGS
jgi:hypothetical protein